MGVVENEVDAAVVVVDVVFEHDSK